jgi:4-amino-4-deoxy-L-arabinose transferase-like glycosyltransferase
MMLPEGALISLAIVVPWYYFQYREHGWEYIGEFVFGENLGRYAETVGEQSRGILFYFPVMFADLFPWSLLIPVAIWWAVRERSADRVARLLVIWIATTVGFFSLSGTKEDLYILPIVAAEAGLIGATLAAAIEGLTPERPIAWSVGVAAALLAVMGSVMFWAFAIDRRYSLDGVALAGVIAVGGGAAAVLLTLRLRLLAAVATAASAVVLISWCTVLCTLPDFERYKPVRPFAAIIKSRASVGAIVGSYKFALPSMVFYLHRPIMEVILPDHLRAVFYSNSDIYFVMPESEYERVKDRLPVKTYILARQQMFDLKPRNFVDGSELPQFVLVSNRE